MITLPFQGQKALRRPDVSPVTSGPQVDLDEKFCGENRSSNQNIIMNGARKDVDGPKQSHIGRRSSQTLPLKIVVEESSPLQQFGDAIGKKSGGVSAPDDWPREDMPAVASASPGTQ
ncbi:hypothetical protein HGRIS_013507 [Hohenbuehelia grisea]|uniref:Uncharacterized protein n=1 Tax=Hohenbuehelia grisea TaxID=104357 RepID=A0ABR3IVX6_9AGAR